MGAELWKRLGWSALMTLLAAPLAYVLRRALGEWGALDPLADYIGSALKVHVRPAAAGWTLALLIVVLLYGVATWLIWRRGPITRFGRPRIVQDPAPTRSMAGKIEYMWPNEAAFYLLYESNWSVNHELSQDILLSYAGTTVSDLAKDGKIASEGRLRDKVDFEKLSPNFWLRAHVRHDERSNSLYRVTPYDGQSNAVTALVESYDAYRFDGGALKRLYPPKVGA